VGGIHQVREQGLGDVEDERIKARLCGARRRRRRGRSRRRNSRRGRATRPVRVAATGGRKPLSSPVEAQVEKVRDGQGEEQTGDKPQGEGGQKGAAQEDEEVRDPDGEFRRVQRLHCGHGGQESQRDEFLDQAERLDGQDQVLDRLRAAQGGAEGVGALRDARCGPRVPQSLAGPGRLAIDRLGHRRRGWR